MGTSILALVYPFFTTTISIYILSKLSVCLFVFSISSSSSLFFHLFQMIHCSVLYKQNSQDSQCSKESIDENLVLHARQRQS